MHQLVILTALTATSGLFGGGSGCRTGYCARPTMSYHAAPACAPRTACHSQANTYVVSGCQQGYAAGCAAPAPVYAPAPATPQAPPAHQAAAYSYPSYYYPAAAAPACPNGNCYRR